MKKIILYVLIPVVIVGLILGFFWWNKNGKNGSNSDQSLNNVKKAGKLVIGNNYPYGVMEFYDKDGKPAGIDIDLGREIASRLGVEAEFKEFDWQDLFTLIENKEVDLVMSALTITEERSKKALFSSPYFNGGQVIVTRTDNKDINIPDDLKNRKIGTQIDTTSQYAAQKLSSDNLITLYDSWESSEEKGEIVYDLKAGKFDAVIVDYIQALESIKKDSEIKIIGEPFTQEYYGIATNLNNNALMQAVDAALRDIKREGILKNIEDKWTKS
ncbi:MAG: transporter substrate-binding domain-containing protein [Candidatus Falkowbacteria bacterium]